MTHTRVDGSAPLRPRPFTFACVFRHLACNVQNKTTQQDAEGTGILNLQQQWQQQAAEQQHMQHMQMPQPPPPLPPMMMHPQHPQQQFNGQQHPNGSSSNGGGRGGRGRGGGGGGGFWGRGRGRGGGGRGGGRGSGGRGGEKAVKDEEDPLFPARYACLNKHKSADILYIY